VPKQFSLGKNERLKSRKQIEQLFSEGKKISVPPFRIYFLLHAGLKMENAKSRLRFGVGVSGKTFKRAVDRNRIKRLTKEAWRLQNQDVKEKLNLAQKSMNVFFIYTGKDIPEYKTIEKKMIPVIQKLVQAIG
jgi:ribonuclease P protein component